MKRVALTAALWWCAAAVAEPITVVAGQTQLVFDGSSPLPVAWTLCAPDCNQTDARRAELFAPGDGYLQLEGLAASAGVAPVVVTEAETVTVDFSLPQGRLVYRLSRLRPEVQLELPAAAALTLATGQRFVPEQLPGFGQIYSRVRPLQVSDAGQQLFDEQLAAGELRRQPQQPVWAGIRNRYWTVLAQVPGGGEIVLALPAADQPRVSVDGQRRYRLYAGPVEWQALRSVDPVLSELLFAALWDFLRALTFGMMMLFGLIHGVVGNHGLAIILLSLTVKILMYPLTALADRWQREVNQINSLLQPELAAIRRQFKGEEAHKQVLAVYRKHRVSQFYTFKSAAGFLIQIPVFIAAFDMLAENFAFNEVGFLWMADLAKPDHFAALPFVLPFFGGYLNLLPFLMTMLSVLAAVLQREATLTAELQRQQSIRLYLMAAAFFVLFYTFPAGMVLYWTSSNLFHLLKVESGRFFVRE